MFSLPSTSMLKYFWEEPATLTALQEYLPASFGVALKSFNIFPLFTIWIVLLSVTFKGQNAQCYFQSQLGCIIKNSSTVFILLLRRKSHLNDVFQRQGMTNIWMSPLTWTSSLYHMMMGEGVPSTSQKRLVSWLTNTDTFVTCSLSLITGGTAKREESWLHTLIINITYKVSLLRPLVSKFYQICALKPAGHIVSTYFNRKWKVLTNAFIISNPYWIFLFQSFELRIHFRINWRENLFILQIT